MLKGLLYIFTIGVLGLLSILFLILFIIKKESRLKNVFLVLTFISLISVAFISLIFTSKVYGKVKREIKETIEIIAGSEQKKDTSDQILLLKKYEPEIYKGKVPADFYHFYGMWDWWRFPLVYPYSITCIDVLDEGTLSNDLGKTNLRDGGGQTVFSSYLNAFIFDEHFLIGKISPGPFKDDTNAGNYLIFNFSNARQYVVDSIELRTKLNELQFKGDTSFISIRNYSNKF